MPSISKSKFLLSFCGIFIGFEKINYFPLYLKMFIWCPMSRFKLELRCPQHDEPLKISRWMGNLKSEGSDNPRLVYDIGGNILLIQRHYSCSMNLEGSNGSGHRWIEKFCPQFKIKNTFFNIFYHIIHHIDTCLGLLKSCRCYQLMLDNHFPLKSILSQQSLDNYWIIF